MGVKREPLFVGITRPAMAFGVPLSGVLINGLIHLELFLMSHSLLVLLGSPCVHVFQWQLCAQDAHIFDCLRLYISHRLPKIQVLNHSTRAHLTAPTIPITDHGMASLLTTQWIYRKDRELV